MELNISKTDVRKRKYDGAHDALPEWFDAKSKGTVRFASIWFRCD